MNATLNSPAATGGKLDTVSVVLAGVGGQGILLASEIVARAALRAGCDVKTNEVHGMAQRGGSVIAQIRFAPLAVGVHSPLVPEGTAAVLGALEQIEALRFAHYLSPTGTAVVSNQAIVPITATSGQAVYPADVRARLAVVFPRLVHVDALALAQQAGTVKAANVVLLGAISRCLELPLDAWLGALQTAVPPQHYQTNLRAFELGRNCS
ncbi:MAG: indolepyruvate oxidoreductase subunit beta [Phycisphaerae bacterium]